MKKILLILPAFGTITSSLALTSCNSKSYSESVKNIVNKLIDMNKTARCTSLGVRTNLDGIRAYITKEAEKAGISSNDICTDDYGNLWFDVLATPGYENYEPIILQAHMDMVVAGLSEEEKAIKPIDVEVEWNKGIVHSKNYKTSLGADDGFGVATILTLIQDLSIKHGPIRALFTADEDSGMLGAAALYNENSGAYRNVLSKMGKDFKGKDIKYLLNIDWETFDQICRSCAGSVTYCFNRTYEKDTLTHLSNEYTLSISGLLGGHSGTELIKNRANAEKCIFEIYYDISQLAENNSIQIAKHYHPDDTGADISFNRNQIVRFATSIFYSNASLDAIQTIINKKVNEWKEIYTGEDWNNVKVNINKTSTNPETYLSATDSSNLIKIIGKNDNPESEYSTKNIWYGYIKDPADEKPYLMSANIAPLEIKYNSTAMKFNLALSSQTRVLTQTAYETIKSYYSNLEISTDQLKTITSDYLPWTTQNYELINYVSESFKKVGITPKMFDATGGVELTWWTRCNPNLICTSIGATINEAHSTSETLYIDTIQPIYDVIVNTFKSLNK